MPQMLIPRKLLPFAQKPKRFKIAIGGRGSGKSMTIADLCLMDAQTKGIKTACFREFQNSIEDSVHSLLTEEVERLGLEGFDCQQSKILYNGEEVFKFRGLARNVEGVKSMHGFQRFWIEEGATISFESLKALTPTLRTEDSEIWISANPKSSADPFSQRFIKPFEKELLKNGYYEDDLHLIVWINYNDNPLFPDVLEQERAFDEKNLSRALYNHIWLGHFYDEVDNSLISVDWFDAAIDAHKKLGFKGEGAIVAAFDPSDEGADSKGYALRHGSVVLDVDELTTGDSADGVDWALDKAISSGADWFAWDCDGLGIALKREVEKGLQGKKIDYFMFRGSQEPENPNESYEPTDDNKKRKTNKETFLNRRAQYYWRLRDKFFNTYKAVVKGEYVNPDDMISLSSEIDCLDQLRAEVCRIPLKRNNNGKIQIMSKLEMSKKPYELPSPNCFISGTKVKTIFGDRSIENISVGALVLTPLGFSRVIATHKNKAEVTKISFGNSSITGTDNHRLFCDDYQSDKISDIKLGHQLRRFSWKKLFFWMLVRLLFIGEKSSHYKAVAGTYAHTAKPSLKGFCIDMFGSAKKAKR